MNNGQREYSRLFVVEAVGWQVVISRESCVSWVEMDGVMLLLMEKLSGGFKCE